MRQVVRLRIGIGLALGVVLLTLPLARTVDAEIYRWVDEHGKFHFTQDLRQVPPAQRGAAEARARSPRSGPSPVQLYRPPPARRSTAPSGRSKAPSGRSTAAASGGGRVHRIRVQRADSSLSVWVRVNGRLDVPFLIDTGATDVVLPQWAADDLELDLSNARTGRYSTANGVVEQKMLRLDSVALGTAEVEDVPATVSASMKEGLLGLSFFNHFDYKIDPVDGVVTLVENDLAETGVLRGGKSRLQWERSFAAAQARIAHAEKRLEEAPFGRVRHRESLEQEVARLEGEMRLLHAEADDARVPFSWRD